jgi:thiamine biosynthesis lipoprotein
LRLWIRLCGVAALLALGFGCSTPLQRSEFTQPHMGTLFKIVVYAPDEKRATAAAEAVSARIEALNLILSDYDPNSEVSRLSASAGSGRAVKVSDDLWNVIDHSQQVARQTRGAFDITVGPAVKLWRQSRKTGKLPEGEQLKAALALIDYRKIERDPAAHTIRLPLAGMLLDLGGIGKGYTADEALKILKARGLDRAMVGAAGDIAVGEAPPGRAGWRIAVDPFGQLDPVAAPLPTPAAATQRFLLLKNAGVSTSGDIHQHVVIAGRRYSHIIDPKTGLGMTTPTAVTVVAPNATTTDGLDTPLCLLGAEEGRKVADALPDIAAIFFRLDGDHITTTESARAVMLKYETAK